MYRVFKVFGKGVKRCYVGRKSRGWARCKMVVACKGFRGRDGWCDMVRGLRFAKARKVGD